MAEQHLRQDKNGMYYWATDEPEQAAERTPPPKVTNVLQEAVDAAEAEVMRVSGMPTPATAAKRTRGPRKAPAPAPITDAVTIPPPPPIIRG